MGHIKAYLNIFKKFTGKGLTTYGGATIDDNGVLTNVTAAGKCAVATELTTAFLNKPHVFQIKFRVPKIGDSLNYLITTSHAGYPEIEITFSFSNGAMSIARIHFKTNGAIYQQKIIQIDYTNIGKWMYCTFRDDGTNTDFTLKENTRIVYQETYSSMKCPYGNQLLTFGHDVDYTLPNAVNVEIDLSETFVRDDNGQIISSWNL